MEQYNHVVDWRSKIVMTSRWKIFGDRVRSQKKNLSLYVICITTIHKGDVCFIGLIRDSTLR